MYYVKRALYGPDPREQKRKVEAEIRKNKREVDRQLAALRTSENKSRSMARQAASRNDLKSVRMLAKELVRSAHHRERLHKSKAQLDSIRMQVNDAFALQKLQGSMQSSAVVMKEVNQLVRLPELMGTMQGLGQELMKAGIIDEMVQDTLESLDEADELEEDNETEIQKVLNDILAPTTPATAAAPPRREPKLAAPPTPSGKAAEAEPEVDEDDQATINDMRERLRALQN